MRPSAAQFANLLRGVYLREGGPQELKFDAASLLHMTSFNLDEIVAAISHLKAGKRADSDGFFVCLLYTSPSPRD